MTRTKSSRALLSVVLAVLMAAAFMPSLTYSSFAATAKKATKVTKLNHTGAKVYGKVGSKYTLKYKLSPSKLTSSAQKTVWKSSDSSVVKVIATRGKHATVKVKSVGTAKITVYTKANTKAKAVWSFKTKEDKTTLTGVTVSAPNAKDPATELKVGTTLQAKAAPEAKDVTYQWYADGTKIDGATSSEFTVTTDQIGKAITVKAASKNEVESAATAKVAAVSMKTIKVTTDGKDSNGKDITTADVSKPIKVGDNLYVSSEVTGAQSINDAASIQWYRVVENKNGSKTDEAISGATSAKYTVTKDDINCTLKAKVTPKTGVTTDVSTDKDGSITLLAGNATTKVEGTVSVTVQVNDKDVTTAALNTALKANVKPADAAVTYQWYKDGTKIDKATDASYTPTTAGKYKVRVALADSEKTYSLPTNATYVDSPEVNVGAKTFDQVTVTDEYAAKDKTDADYRITVVAGDKLTVEVPVLGKTLEYGTDYTVTVYKNGTEVEDKDAGISTVDKNAVFTIPTNATVGTQYKFVVKGTGNYAGTSKETAVTKVDFAGDVSKVDAFKSLASTLTSTTNTLTVTLPTTDQVYGKDYTVSFQKLVTSANGSQTWTDLTDSVKEIKDTDGKVTGVSYELGSADKDSTVTEYRAVVKGINNYTGVVYGTNAIKA